MSAFNMTRRASLGVFGAVALACASAPGGAFALTRAVGGIHVDVAPLRENAGDPTAAWVAQAMPGALAQALAEVRPARRNLRQNRLRHPGAEHRQRRRTGRLVSGPDGRGGDHGRRQPAAARALTSYYPAASDPARNRTENSFDRVFQLSRAFA